MFVEAVCWLRWNCGDEKQSKQQRKGQARRWVVERTHSWMNRFRQLLVRWEKREETYLAMLHFACGLITWRAALAKLVVKSLGWPVRDAGNQTAR